MIVHRTRELFWHSKSGALGRAHSQLRQAPPNWSQENRLRAIELWFHIRFGANAFSELKKTVAAADRADKLSVETRKSKAA
jgi:hypothetical protein